MKNNKPERNALRLAVFVCLAALGSGACLLFSRPPAQELSSSPVVAATTAATAQAEAGTAPPDVQHAALLPAARAEAAGMTSASRYDIALAVDWEALTFQGHASVVYTNAEDDPLDSLYFRMLPNGGKSYGGGSLLASNITLDNQPVESQLSVDDSALEVILPEPLDPGGRVQVDMDFSGVVPRDFEDQSGSGGYGIYNYSDGVLALAGWYPILAVYDEDGWNLDPVSAIGDSVYSDIAFYTVAVTIPTQVQVFSTGVETGRSDSGGMSSINLVSGPARDFFLVASPDFQAISREVEGTTISSVYLPGHKQSAETALSAAEESLRIYNDRIGRYPYTELELVEAPMRYALGVEFPEIVLISSDLYQTPERPEFSVTAAHEVAHQWWYNLVGNDVFEEPWLDEALATYSSALYYEAGPGGGSARGLTELWQERYNHMLKAGGDDLVTQGLAHFEGAGQDADYGGVVYIKGALFLAALRGEIGDAAFFDGLQNYFQEFQYKIAATPDLLEAFEQSSGRDLDDIYQEWLYSTAD